MRRFLLLRGAEVLIMAVLAAVPLAVTNPYALGLLTLLAIYGVLLIGLDVSVGYLGQINLGQVAFLGLGAYAAGIAVTRFGAGLVPALLAASLVGLVLGGILALPALRLDGPQFALATLSFSALTVTALNELEGLTGGAQGLSLVRPRLLGLPLESRGFYWLCLAALALVWITMRNLLGSHWGRAFEALRDSPIATDAMGVGTYRHKVAAFALGSGLGGLAGGLYAFNFQYLQPQIFTYDLMVILLLGVVLGGRKSLWGAFVGACVVVLLPNLLSDRRLFLALAFLGLLAALAAGVRNLVRRRTGAFQALAPVAATGLLAVGGLLVKNTEDWRKAIFALLLFAVVVGLPEGLMGFASRFLTGIFRVPPASLPPRAGLDEVLPQQQDRPGPVLEVKDLRRYFGGVKAVDGITFAVETGTIHGLIGPNGSGKSTLVNVVSGLYPPTGGEIRLRGSLITRLGMVPMARAGVARTFQNLQLFGELSALDNVLVALHGAFRMPLPLLIAGLGRAEERRAQADALALLALVGLESEARVRARDLTYGAQRFLEVARALARRPALLILDEPAAGLAHPDVLRLMEVIRKIHERGIAVLLIEHHMDVVSELCHYVTVMDGGRMLAEGSASEVKRDPRVLEAYLGVPREAAS
ncbi:ATP-binding cassette domain-containing protein [Geothrix sp. 21YS21S-2]|uniref:branched-chain amino acid ABC transporter ATP-binding protein/permease n=1 Tax=Geothrix sp. 21YS21S-2 TaxID=3068893 RepID=UPI0027B985DD|nr:branched-chain amino acid ABC transporter ATP-binding protein/permease [Geothrix sp. 21YS21S-2]